MPFERVELNEAEIAALALRIEEMQRVEARKARLAKFNPIYWVGWIIKAVVLLLSFILGLFCYYVLIPLFRGLGAKDL